MHPIRHPIRAHRARPRQRPAALLVALVAASTSSCSVLPFGAGGGASTGNLADGSTFLVAAPTRSGADALVSGRPALVGGDCVGLQTPGGGEEAAPALPHGTRPADDGRGIVLPGGLQIALGDPLSGGGGCTTSGLAADAFAPWPDAPSGCSEGTCLASIHDVTVGEPPQG